MKHNERGSSRDPIGEGRVKLVGEIVFSRGLQHAVRFGGISDAVKLRWYIYVQILQIA